MNCIVKKIFTYKPLSRMSGLAFACSLIACTGGAIHFENGVNAQVSVDENSTSVAWKSVALVDAQGSPKGLVYKISGLDASQLAINSTTGEVTFKQFADYEKPLDTDKNNEYVIDVEASFNGQSATQNVRIKVKDVTKPEIVLIKPKPNENVGVGSNIEVEMVVRLYDAESNTPLKDSSVTLNTSPLVKDSVDAQLWRGKVVVPEDGVTLSLVVLSSGSIKIKSNAKLFNKRNAINPSYLAVYPDNYLMFLDPYRGLIGRLNLANSLWSSYFETSRLKNMKPIFDFNYGFQHVYAVEQQPTTAGEIFAFGVASSIPSLFSAGCLQGVANITYDNAAKRILVLTKNTDLGTEKFRVLNFAVNSDTGYTDAKSPAGACLTAAQNIVWNIPAGVIRGTYKDFNFNRVSKTYIVADERTVNGSAVTVIQGFSETGEKRFEAQVGPDISNLAVNQAEGIVYVAEHRSTAAGKIKTINISTGEVGDLVEFYNASPIGGYADLRMDNINKRLYIGDDVSDSIFVVNLPAKSMSELTYTQASEPISEPD